MTAFDKIIFQFLNFVLEKFIDTTTKSNKQTKTPSKRNGTCSPQNTSKHYAMCTVPRENFFKILVMLFESDFLKNLKINTTPYTVADTDVCLSVCPLLSQYDPSSLCSLLLIWSLALFVYAGWRHTMYTRSFAFKAISSCRSQRSFYPLDYISRPPLSQGTSVTEVKSYERHLMQVHLPLEKMLFCATVCVSLAENSPRFLISSWRSSWQNYSMENWHLSGGVCVRACIWEGNFCVFTDTIFLPQLVFVCVVFFQLRTTSPVNGEVLNIIGTPFCRTLAYMLTNKQCSHTQTLIIQKSSTNWEYWVWGRLNIKVD